MINIGEILVKIHKNTPLSEEEVLQLGIWGNNAEFNDNFIAALQNGTANLNVNNVTAFSGEFRYPPYGLSSSIYVYSGVSGGVPTSTETMATFYSIRYDDLGGYSAGTTFRIPFSGKYQVDLWMNWTGGTTGIRQSKVINVNYGYMTEYDSKHPNSTAVITNYIHGEVSLVGGSDLSIELYQNSGVECNATGRMEIRLIRNYDGDIV